jgi:hypothetical protein
MPVCKSDCRDWAKVHLLGRNRGIHGSWPNCCYLPSPESGVLLIRAGESATPTVQRPNASQLHNSGRGFQAGHSTSLFYCRFCQASGRPHPQALPHAHDSLGQPPHQTRLNAHRTFRVICREGVLQSIATVLTFRSIGGLPNLYIHWPG